LVGELTWGCSLKKKGRRKRETTGIVLILAGTTLLGHKRQRADKKLRKSERLTINPNNAWVREGRKKGFRQGEAQKRINCSAEESTNISMTFLLHRGEDSIKRGGEHAGEGLFTPIRSRHARDLL